MRKWYLLAVMASTVTFVTACGPGLPGDGSGQPTPTASASASAPMSPSDLPTLATPTAPPTSPTDTLPKGVLAGRVTGLTETCMDLTLDDGTAWSLLGDAGDGVDVGSTVVARVVKLAEGEEACGSGLPARLVSVRVVS